MSSAHVQNPPHRRVSTRRGSTTAPDPFGAHSAVNLNPNRTSSSTLTIVRVPSNSASPAPLALNEPPASPVLSQRRLHRRPNPASEPANTRVSFAFSSFGGGSGSGGPANPRSSSPSGSHPPSPSSSPRLRPSSPHLSGSSASFGGKPRLTPDQLVDLARQSTVPRPQIADLSTPSVPQPTPATFTPLPDDIYLPFIDRPSEVASLISSPPDAKLFYILAHTFPANPPPLHIANPSSAVGLADQVGDLPRDPAHWTYTQLIHHLTKIDRGIAPDFIWTVAARKCVISHSELIWERIKGALGVPPELDVDFDFLQDDQDSPDTSDISDDEGRAARGHWSDWDDVMDSPMYARNPKRLSTESPSASIYFGKRGDDQEAHFRAHLDDRLHGLQDSGYQQSSATMRIGDVAAADDDTGEITIAPTPHSVRSPPGNFSPPLITHREPTLDGGEYLSIEPLIAPSTSPSGTFGSHSGSTPFALPSSMVPGDGLGDIAEGAEEEEAEVESPMATVGSTSALGLNPSNHLSPGSGATEEEGYISPSQIQGLRISTSPMPPSSASNTALNSPPILSPISPLPPYPPVQPSSSSSSINNGYTGTGTSAQPIPASSSSRTHSRASSFSSVGPFQRSESTGNFSASWFAAGLSGAAGSWGHVSGASGMEREGKGSQYAASVVGSDAGDSSGYISDGDRMPGNPLFPSNFARLAGGPTMRANNPATRNSSTVPHARYVSNATFTGPSLANRPGKTRAYSHGATMTSTGPPGAGPTTMRAGAVGASFATANVNPSPAARRQSWGTGGVQAEGGDA